MKNIFFEKKIKKIFFSKKLLFLMLAIISNIFPWFHDRFRSGNHMATFYPLGCSVHTMPRTKSKILEFIYTNWTTLDEIGRALHMSGEKLALRIQLTE